MDNNCKYNIEYSFNDEQSELLLEVRFVSNEFKNTELVKYVIKKLKQLRDKNLYQGIPIVKINGSVSIPLAYVFAHEIKHYVSVIAFNYPPLDSFIVTYSAHPQYQIGDTINKITNTQKSLKLDHQISEAFTANLHENTLNINCKLAVVEGDVLTKEAALKIDELMNQNLTGGDLLKINGKSSVAVNFMIANKLAHLYGNIAVWDPKLCDYVITLRHGGKYAEGELIHHVSPKTFNQKKIVICGGANRGKTVLRDGLNRVLSKYIPSQNYFVISGCPDGDGSWFNDTYRNHPQKANELKQKYKTDFTIEFANSKAQEICPINTPLLLFDVGGKTINEQLTPENKIIMTEATHALIVGGNEQEIAVWRRCCQQLNLPVIAEITSQDWAGEDFINRDNPVFSVTIHQLLRGHPVGKGVDELAKFLADSLS